GRVRTQEERGWRSLGEAVAISLSDFVRRPKTAGVKKKQAPATARQLERFTDMLLEALRMSGYIQPVAAASAQEKVRRLVRRLKLEARDAEVWLGMLRQIAWKLRADRK